MKKMKYNFLSKKIFFLIYVIMFLYSTESFSQDEQFEDSDLQTEAEVEDSSQDDFNSTDNNEKLPCNLPVKISAFVFPESPNDMNVATEVLAGFRRGFKTNTNVEFVDPTDDILARFEPDDNTEVERGKEIIDNAMEELQNRNWRQINTRAEEAWEIFDANLSLTPRQYLIKTLILQAISSCMTGNRSTCERKFADVIIMRPTFEYDTSIYPEKLYELFEEIRQKTTEGIRGSVQINSIPPGGEVFLDGRFVGSAPTRIEGLIVGDHYVTIKLLGYHKIIQRVTVSSDREETVDVELTRYVRAPAIQEMIDQARLEMGTSKRVGPNIVSLGKGLLLRQVVLSEVKKAGPDIKVHAYLYDIETGFLLKEVKGQFTWEGRDLSVAENLAKKLYENVDICGRIQAELETPPPPPEPPLPFYKRWWFWTIIGSATVGVAVGTYFIVDSVESEIPDNIYQLIFR